jgi:hypothetical protein
MKTAAQLRNGSRARYKAFKKRLDQSGGMRLTCNLGAPGTANLTLICNARSLNQTEAVELALETLATIINQGETS